VNEFKKNPQHSLTNAKNRVRWIGQASV